MKKAVQDNKTPQQRFIDDGLAAYWRIAEMLGDAPWAGYLRDWVVETRKKIDEVSPKSEPYVPLVNEGSFVLYASKQGDFSLRVYHQQLEVLNRHEIYANPQAAAKTNGLREEFLDDSFEFASQLRWHQSRLALRIQNRLETEPDFLTYGDRHDSHLSFWLDSKTLIPTELGQWPTPEAFIKVIQDMRNSYAELHYYTKSLGFGGGQDRGLTEYTTLLYGALNFVTKTLNELGNSLNTIEPPPELYKMIEEDMAKSRSGFAQNKLVK